MDLTTCPCCESIDIKTNWVSNRTGYAGGSSYATSYPSCNNCGFSPTALAANEKGGSWISSYAFDDEDSNTILKREVEYHKKMHRSLVKGDIVHAYEMLECLVDADGRYPHRLALKRVKSALGL